MQNDYLTNKKKYDSVVQKKYNLKNKSITNFINSKKPNNVDINKLLNKVKINEKNQKKEKLILLSIASLVVGVAGIISII
jgi:hypothetical protein|tara:strand:- start:59 stop:298 length:240 start_codon:yes stop_codon:yes gene_type:complete